MQQVRHIQVRKLCVNSLAGWLLKSHLWIDSAGCTVHYEQPKQTIRLSKDVEG